MTDSSGASSQGASSSINVGRVVEVAAGYLAVIGFLFYPIGVLVLALQLWNAYSYRLSDALFAVSLVPITAAATRVLDFLAWAFVAMGIAQQIGTAITAHKQSELLAASLDSSAAEGGEDPRRMSYGFFKYFRTQLAIIIFLTLTAPFALQLVYFVSWRTWLLYVIFVVLSVVGVVAAGAVTLMFEQEPIISLSANWKATLIAYGFGILAGISLTGTSIPDLPSVEFQSATPKKGQLLAHKEGYWYVFDSEGTLEAVSDDDAGDVRFLRRDADE